MNKWEKRFFVVGAAVVFACMFPFYGKEIMGKAWAKVMMRVKGA